MKNAILVELTTSKPADVVSMQVIGDYTPSISKLVTSARKHHLAGSADSMAEIRVWGTDRRVIRADLYPLAEGERYSVTVAYVGEKTQALTGWNRLIWTNQPPHHNVARVFVGREELDD